MSRVIDDIQIAQDTITSGQSFRASVDQNAFLCWCYIQRILAFGAMIALIPVFAVLFVAVKISSPGPFLYRQMRFGKGGQAFETLKIRTMAVGADKDSSRAICVRQADPSITRLGRLLRDLKLDELPQLWNVVRGDMLIVGPRPIAPALQQHLEQEIPGFRHRLMVRPGLTSLAQICIIRNREGSGVLGDWQLRFEAEQHYIANRSIAYDAIIIMMTIIYLARRFCSETMVRRLGSTLKLTGATACCILLAGCLGYGGTVESSAPLTRLRITDNGPVEIKGNVPAIEREIVTIPAEKVGKPDKGYRVGPGDVLAINIFDEPGLNELLLRVDDTGKIQMPVVEDFTVSGMTETEIRDALKKSFSERFNNPWVIVQVAEYKSQPIYLLGEFNSPGVRYLDIPTNVVQAIGKGNGLSDAAYLKAAQLRRNGKIVPIDLQAVLREGKDDQNLWLQPGDTLFVPNVAEREAYILGAVNQPGSISLATKKMSLVQAISEAGGPITPGAKMEDVRVIRTNSPLEGELLVVDTNAILSGQMLDIPLQADDIVFVPKNAIGDWNDVVATIAPSLQLVGATIQPFVQVKFLLDDN